MKFGPPKNSPKIKTTFINNNNALPIPLPLPNLPPSALQWSAAASAAAAISYADRGTSAIAASSLLNELHWTEGQLGEVQSAFFAGYALTQVLGGLLGGQKQKQQKAATIDPASSKDSSSPVNVKEVESGGYRTVLPISLFFTGVTTVLFPLAATLGGVAWASADRFCLGLLEGLLLPAAMAGVSATTSASTSDTSSDVDVDADSRVGPSFEVERINEDDNKSGESDANNNNNKATASSLVIAGCYVGSAWAYLSAWFLFSERFQLQMLDWGLHEGFIWPWVFYVNGILSMGCLFLFRDEFNLFGPLGSSLSNRSRSTNSHQSAIFTTSYAEKCNEDGNDENVKSDTTASLSTKDGNNSIWKDTLSIAQSTLSSKSGRAILAAQAGQGALLYSIASWGPLYLERVNNVAMSSGVQQSASAIILTESARTAPPGSSVSAVAATASIAASSLILPQITQALVGVSIGATADRLSSEIGTKTTRRGLQILSGVVPAVLLWYLAQVGSSSGVDENTNSFVSSEWLTPAFLFGTAQTISALSLGAVSVSHLDVAAPSKAGAVYALGNVAAAASGSFMVNLFGRLLELEDGGSTSVSISGSGGAEFALPFRVVAILSAAGSLIYGCTVETELEIGFNGTATDE